MWTKYSDETIMPLTTTYQHIRFPSSTDCNILLRNDDKTGVIEYSFNNTDKAGELRPGESYVMDRMYGYGGIDLRYVGSAPRYRMMMVGK